MSQHDHDPHDHVESAPLAQRARRDLLGLAELLGPDSGLVPISDLDAGAAWPSACGAVDDAGAANDGTRELDQAFQEEGAHGALLTVCGSCSTRCASLELALSRADSCATEPTS